MAQVVEVRGKKAFVCEYTGVLLQHRFFIPTGKTLKGKQGSYCSLPVLLRAQQDDGVKGDDFVALKKKLCKFYDQEDIPVAPELSSNMVPLADPFYEEYLNRLPLGLSWLLVKGRQSIDDYDIPVKKLPRRAPVSTSAIIKPQSVGKGKERKSVFKLKKGVYVVKKNTVTHVADVTKVASVAAAMTKDNGDMFTKVSMTGSATFLYRTALGNENSGDSVLGDKWIAEADPCVLSPFLMICTKQTVLPAPDIPRKSRKRAADDTVSEVRDVAVENPFGPKSPSEEGSDK